MNMQVEWPVDDKQLNSCDFVLSQTIHSGKSSDVLLAQQQGNRSVQLVCKKIRKADFKYVQNCRYIKGEVQTLQKFISPFKINFIGTINLANEYLIFTELAQGITLLELAAQGLARAQKVHLAAQIVLLLQHLDQKDYVHRDIKPQNFIVSKKGELKAVSFNFSRMIKPGSRCYTFCGTPQFMSPQVLTMNGYGKSVDWWALGCLIYELLQEKQAFTGQVQNVFMQILKHRSDKLTLNYQVTSQQDQSLIDHLTHWDFSKRLGYVSESTKIIKSHKFFEGVDWQRLQSSKAQLDQIPASNSLKVKKQRRQNHKYINIFF